MNQPVLILVHANVVLFTSFFLMISINLIKAVLPMMYFYENISVVLLVSCEVLIFPGKGNLVEHLRMIFY